MCANSTSTCHNPPSHFKLHMIMREAINNEIRFQQFQGFKHLSELWNFVGIEPQGQLKGGQGVTEEPKRNFTQFATMQSSFLKLCPATIRKNYFYSPLPPYKNHWFIWSCTFPSIENAFPRTFPFIETVFPLRISWPDRPRINCCTFGGRPLQTGTKPPDSTPPPTAPASTVCSA